MISILHGTALRYPSSSNPFNLAKVRYARDWMSQRAFRYRTEIPPQIRFELEYRNSQYIGHNANKGIYTSHKKKKY